MFAKGVENPQVPGLHHKGRDVEIILIKFVKPKYCNSDLR